MMEEAPNPDHVSSPSSSGLDPNQAKRLIIAAMRGEVEKWDYSKMHEVDVVCLALELGELEVICRRKNSCDCEVKGKLLETASQIIRDALEDKVWLRSARAWLDAVETNGYGKVL